MSARIPFDDHKLEMEETEGLIVSPPPRNKVTTKSENRASGNRWACFMLFVGILLGILLTSDTASLRFWEGPGGSNVNDVEEKENESTLNPSSQAQPTPSPIDEVPLTHAPTPEPTPAPTDQIVATPQPTDAVVVTPQPTEAVVVETPQPTDAVVTPQPTDAVVVATPQPTDAVVVTTQPTDAVVATPETATDEPPKTIVAKGIPGAVPKENIDAVDVDFGPAHYPKPSTVVRPLPPLTSERADALAKEWGRWEFVDKKATQRPKEDYCGKFPNRDIPRDKFPANAWQTDTEYLKDWLDQGTKLVDRALEAILSEYGRGTKDEPGKSFEEREKEMFQWLILEPGTNPPGKGLVLEAGWTTQKSFEGLTRRVLHSIVTQDPFTFVVGGHSAAAGHGNHFKQSYAMQFHKVTEPVFGLLGVPLHSHNVAQGGLGTIQHSLGFRDLYGPNIDFMVWDSGMTEGRDDPALDMFWRQAIISGDRVPFLLGAGFPAVLMYYYENAGVDIGNYGEGLAGIPECSDEVQCETLPWATRYMKCSTEALGLCRDNRWRSNCWVEREDVTPREIQAASPSSQVGWHPGFRSHQLVGRSLSFLVLKALKEALAKWKETAGFAIPDDAWHVTDYYNNIRKKFHEKVGETPCFKSESWPSRMCSMPIRGFTEFQPRPNPVETSLVGILKPASNGFKPHIHPGNLYNGPDVFNPFTAIPEGEIDVLAIVSNGRTFEDQGQVRRLDSNEAIEPGLGTELNGAHPGYCDGTYNSECSRQGNCLLLGHGDSRGCLFFNSYSGWIVMTLPQVKEGLIIAKIETWHSPQELPIASSWKSINNQGRRQLRGFDSAQGNFTFLHRELFYGEEQNVRTLRRKKAALPEFCDNFKFEFALDGKITSWDTATFQANSKVPQRVVEIQTLLDDPNFTTEPKDVEVAIRMTGCGDSTQKTMCLSHMYYA